MNSNNGDGHTRQAAVILWTVAFLLTTGTAVFQRVTGPTFPVFGNSTIGEKEVIYRFDRSHGGPTDAPVVVHVPDTSIAGILEWRMARSNAAWSSVAMNYSGAALSGSIPYQLPATKVRYRVLLRNGSGSLTLPSEDGVVLRFKGEVPLGILVAHIIVIFTAMFFSTRAGLEWFQPRSSIRTLTVLTTILLGIGGLLLGPLVQKYAFDAYWTGWPVGKDLTDNKTAIAFLAWIVVWIAYPRVRKPQTWALVAAIVTLAVFLIPHSLLGSERELAELDKSATQQVHSP